MSDEIENTNESNNMDNMLKESFLNLNFNDPKNEKILDSISKYVMVDNASQLPSKKNEKIKIKFNLNTLLLISFSIILITSIFLYLKLNKKSDHDQTKITKNKTTTLTTNVTLNSNSEHSQLKIVDHNIPENLKEVNSVNVLLADSENLEYKTDLDIPSYTEPIVYSNTSITTEVMNDTTYIFPKLIEKEIKANNKQKRKMAESLFKLQKNQFAKIPKNGLNSLKDNEEYYMSTHEITNLEYRTFLFDLLIQNKKEAFMKAKPNQSLWVNCTGNHKYDSYKDGYFSDKIFNQYPVVNISVEAAQMYCVWLNETVMELASSKNNATEKYTVRIPTLSEWKHCAKGGLEGDYPWGGDSIQNKKNLFLANFCAQKSKEKFNLPIIYPFKTNPNAYTTGGYALNSDTVTTVMAFAYNPNWYGLYCMSGNVSEWVKTDDNKAVKVMGGNWASDFEYLKINNNFEFKGRSAPSPFIGFRPIISIKK